MLCFAVLFSDDCAKRDTLRLKFALKAQLERNRVTAQEWDRQTGKAGCVVHGRIQILVCAAVGGLPAGRWSLVALHDILLLCGLCRRGMIAASRHGRGLAARGCPWPTAPRGAACAAYNPPGPTGNVSRRSEPGRHAVGSAVLCRIGRICIGAWRRRRSIRRHALSAVATEVISAAAEMASNSYSSVG